MRYRLILLLLLSTSVLAQSPPPNGIIGYGITAGQIPSPIQPTYLTWQWQRFSMVITGNLPGMSGSKPALSQWVTYVDGSNIYTPDIYIGLRTATTQGWADPEGFMLHMSANYYVANGRSGQDMFDYYEQPAGSGQGRPSLAVNGVFTLVGSTYTDVTKRAYCPVTTPLADASCSGFTASPIQVSDRLLIGQQIPFDTVNFTITTARVGGAVTFNYWNGTSFVPLFAATDTTNGLTTTGTLTFTPSANWVPAVKNGSQSKYWIEAVVSGAPTTSPVVGRIYGDNLTSACSYGSGTCQRGWNPATCSSGHVNVGTPVEYCAVPSSSASAKFRQQARALGYTGYYNDVYGNPLNIQSTQNTWAYVEAARTAANLLTGENGVMFDNAQGQNPVQTPTFASTNTELGSTTFQAAQIAQYPALHTLLTSIYGTSPKFWDGMNSSVVVSAQPKYTSMNWFLSESYNSTTNDFGMDTSSPLYLCTSSVWCRGSATTNNPNGTIEMIQIQDNTQFGVKDGNGSALTNYHSWDMYQRGPMNALARYYMTANTNTYFTYNPAGTIYADSDWYYYWVTSARTLAAPLTAQTCSPACTITISGALETSTNPDTSTEGYPLRINGRTVVGVTSYTGTTLTTTNQIPSPILNNESIGASIEYVVKSHQSQDSPLHTPIFMWGYFVPASAVYLGTPDLTFGFDTPCTGNGIIVNGGCIAATGPAITGNSACAPNNCSPLLRRDFTGGTYGKAIVLMRPVTPNNTKTASTEYDTYSISYALPGTYYRLNSDGSVDTTPHTSYSLRGGESVILVGTNTFTFSGVQLSKGIQMSPGNQAY